MLLLNRYRSRNRSQHRRQHCDGPHRWIGFWVGNRRNSNCSRNRTFYPYHYWSSCVLGCVFLHHRFGFGLQLARGCNLSDRHHRGKRTWRFACYSHCMLDPDCQAHGKKELFGQELGSRRDSWVYVNNLFRQNRNSDTKSHDSLSHVVRWSNHWSRHHWKSIR